MHHHSGHLNQIFTCIRKSVELIQQLRNLESWAELVLSSYWNHFIRSAKSDVTGRLNSIVCYGKERSQRHEGLRANTISEEEFRRD